MSVAQNPLTGPMKNSMGNFTTYTLHGMNIIRSKAFKPKDPKSEKQLNMRARMSRIAELYRKCSPVISLGFPERKEYQSPQNLFVSSNFNTAFVEVDQKPVISYPLMLIAKGSLPPVTITDATIDSEGVTLRYDSQSLAPDLNADDEIMACALLDTGSLLKTRQFIGYEAIGTIQLKYQNLQAEEVVCCYVFVRSGNGDKASDSVWVPIIQ